jgi:hypothetical protein
MSDHTKKPKCSMGFNAWIAKVLRPETIPVMHTDQIMLGLARAAYRNRHK